MLPFFNPYLGTTPPASQQVQQVPQPNPGSHVNPTNTMPNPLQMGMLNPQSSIPLIPNMPNQFGFLPFQNNHLGVPHLGSAQSLLGSFNPQNCVQNLGQGAYQSNLGQSANLLGQSSTNLPGNFQFCLPSMNQNFPMSMPNLNQVTPYNVLHQLAQVLGSQNPSFMPNQFVPLGVNGVGENVHQDKNKLGPPTMGSNALNQPPVAAQQLHGNWSSMATSSVQPQQNWKNHQPSNFVKLQGNVVKDVGVNNSNSNWKNSPHKKFAKNPKGKDSHWGSRKSQLHHMQNARGAAGTSNKDRGKGQSNNMAGNFCHPNHPYQDQVEKRRPLPLSYTEQEIQNWREERKKNYPSKTNLEKKSAEKFTNSQSIEAEAKSRRQKLKEILAKQAELGVEVAEIPSHYLSDSEKQQSHGKKENNKKAFGKERFQNRGNKRRQHDKKQWRRHDQEDGFSKKQRLAGNDSGETNASNQPPLNNKKQTLLQKLLSTDIKRDKKHLLQVFRFMVMNSFFKESPEKPLKFPLVVVKETGFQGEVVDLKSSPSPTGEDVTQGSKRASAEEFSNVGEEGDDAKDKETGHSGKVEGMGGDEIDRSEEEGEIID